MPRYVLFAGVNGAGKTTMYHTNPEYKKMDRINNDEILRSFGGDWRNKQDEKKAALLAVSIEKELLDNKKSFCKETVLAGKGALSNIKMYKGFGYYIEMVYVGVDSAETAIERIKARVSRGGHGIPENTVRERYHRSLNNLARVIPYCNKVTVYDNTEKYKTLATFENGKLLCSINEIPEWFSSVLLGFES